MTHFYVFCYIAALLTGVAALTIQLLSGRCDAQRRYSTMNPFIIMTLMVDLYDFLIYYNDHVMHHEEGRLIISAGGCLLAVLLYFWAGVTESNVNGRRCNKVRRTFQIYVLFYVGAVSLSILFLPTHNWIRIVLDIPLLAGMLTVSGYLITKGRRLEPGKVTAYKVMVTVLLSLETGTYFMRETGIDHGDVMDLTIIYLLVINIANILLLYLRDFTFSCTNNLVDEKKVWNHIAGDYCLTERELEVLEKVYDGRTNTEIADKFFISERTVKAHIHNIFKKMEVKNRVETFCLVRSLKEKYKHSDY